MAELTPCAACSELVHVGTCACPHCGGKACVSRSPGKAALLLGLTLAAGCGGKEPQPDYGVAVTDTGSPPTGTGTITGAATGTAAGTN